MSESKNRRWSKGFTLLEVMAVTAIMGTLYSQSGGAYKYTTTAANEVRGKNNLRQVYMLLVANADQGYPKAALYPKGDPRTDPTSIIRMLPGAQAELFISPFAPDALRAKGLTFAWNDTVNGKQLDQVPGNTWLLIDLAAFIADPKVPKPDRYLILYANGQSESVRELPADIQKAVKEAEGKLKESQEKK